MNKSFIIELAELIDRHMPRGKAQMEGAPRPNRLACLLRWFLPNGGTLILIALLILTQNALARQLASPTAPGPSATTVNYQGRLADHSGNPLSGTYGMSFALYDAATGGNLVWGPENHTAVPVSNGLFSVGLGSQTSGGIPTSVWNGDRYLEIAVGSETLAPRELIRSVPIAGMALTVPDGAITAGKIVNGAVTQEKAPTLIRDLANSNTVIQYGYTDNVQGDVWITFPQPFNQTPLVFITQREAAGGFGNYLVSAVSTTGFYIDRMGTSNYGNVQWVAIGR